MVIKNNKDKNFKMFKPQKIGSNNKNDLLDKMKERKEISNEKRNNNGYDDLKEEILKYKELYKKVKKELNELERTTEEKIQMKIGYVRKEYSKLEIENIDLKNEKDQLLDVINKNGKEILMLSDKLDILNNVKYNLKTEKEKVYMLQDLIDYKFSKIDNVDEKINKINILVNDSKRMKNENEKLMNDKLNIKLRLEIEKKEKEMLSDENIQLKQKIEKLNIENDALKDNVTVNYKDKISILINSINDDNWSEFSGSFTLYKQYSYHYKNALSSLKERQNEIRYIFGYYNKESKIFSSINGDEFLAVDIRCIEGSVNRMPAKAYITEEDENEVVICKVYTNLDTYKTEMQLEIDFKNKNNNKEKSKIKEYQNIGKEKITFITTLNGNKCKTNIAKYGFDTEWIKPNEDSIGVIRNKLYQSDLIVVYPKYCTHSVTNIIDNNVFNVLYCYSFNEEILINEITNKIYEIRKEKSSDMCQ